MENFYGHYDFMNHKVIGVSRLDYINRHFVDIEDNVVEQIKELLKHLKIEKAGEFEDHDINELAIIVSYVDIPDGPDTLQGYDRSLWQVEQRVKLIPLSAITDQGIDFDQVKDVPRMDPDLDVDYRVLKDLADNWDGWICADETESVFCESQDTLDYFTGVVEEALEELKTDDIAGSIGFAKLRNDRLYNLIYDKIACEFYFL